MRTNGKRFLFVFWLPPAREIACSPSTLTRTPSEIVRDDALSRCQDLQECALQPDFCTCGRKFRLLEKVMVDYK